MYKRQVLWNELLTHANPLPSLAEWALGINHKSDREEHAGQLWEPVRAIHSNKMFCLKQLEEAMLAASGAPVASIRTVPVWRERPERGLAASGRLQGTACEAERVFSRPADCIRVAEEARERTFAASGAQETAQEPLPR